MSSEFEVKRDPEVVKKMLTSVDCSFDGVPSSAAMNFNPYFGKISRGEHFKALFTV